MENKIYKNRNKKDFGCDGRICQAIAVLFTKRLGEKVRLVRELGLMREASLSVGGLCLSAKGGRWWKEVAEETPSHRRELVLVMP